MALAAPGSEGAREFPKVWLIGWDGMAPWIVEPLMAAGALPNLRRLADGGTVGEVESIAPAISPALWTTIATGKDRDQHGITSFWEGDDQGGEKLFTSRDRTAAPLWQMVDAFGRRSAVIGWWATWPAESIRGTIVSDRFARSRFDFHPRNAEPKPPEGLVSPAEAEADLRSCVRNPSDISASELGRFVPGTSLSGESLKLHDRLAELRIVFARDEAHWCIASRLLSTDEAPIDFLAMHIQGTDIVSHYFLKYQYPELWIGDPVSREPNDDGLSFHDTIAAYYRWQDYRLGQLLSLADSRTIVIVLSDHGFRVHGRDSVPTVSGGHMGSPPPPGFLVAWGPGIRAGHRLDHASVLDIAPTVLTLLGLPTAHDQPGAVLAEALVRPPDAAWVETYGTGIGAQSVPAGPLLDEEMIQSLKAVGYTGR